MEFHKSFTFCYLAHKQAVDVYSSRDMNVFLDNLQQMGNGSQILKSYRIEAKSLDWVSKSSTIFLKISTITCPCM